MAFEGWESFHRDVGLLYPKSKGTAMAITDDGKMIIVAATIEGLNIRFVSVFRQTRKRKYESRLDPIYFGQVKPNAVAITNDHLWAVAGYEDGTVGIYYFSAELD